MRFVITVALALGLGTSLASAQVTPPPASAPAAAGKARETISAPKSTNADAVADCERMWDRGTHMTKQEWARTCRRVQDRLQQNQLK